MFGIMVVYLSNGWRLCSIVTQLFTHFYQPELRQVSTWQHGTILITVMPSWFLPKIDIDDHITCVTFMVM